MDFVEFYTFMYWLRKSHDFCCNSNVDTLIFFLGGGYHNMYVIAEMCHFLVVPFFEIRHYGYTISTKWDCTPIWRIQFETSRNLESSYL